MENKIIGRVFATEKCPTTIDEFVFWTESTLILNPFDIVKVNHVDESFSYGVIEDISHITDAASFLTPFISSDFGDLESADSQRTMRVSMNYVKASVICNDRNIYIPLQNNAAVMLATSNEITYALGLKSIKNPLTCGYLEMYEGTRGGGEKVTLPVCFNSKYIIGPEGAHLNISGISGLAAKTSYAMFLLKAIQDGQMKAKEQNADDGGAAFVLFNVKGRDLLAIDQENDFSEEKDAATAKAETYKMYEELGLSTKPFSNVHYYYPYSQDISNKRNTYMDKGDVADSVKCGKAKYFKYLYKQDRDSLDLLFADIDDSTQTMDSIINYIMTGQGGFPSENSTAEYYWDSFIETVKGKTVVGGSGDKEISVASWRKFYRIVNKAIGNNPLFARGTSGNRETRLEDEIMHIKKNDVYVIDIAKLTDAEQAFVFGDTMRKIYNLKQGVYDNEITDETKSPSRIIVFIDELNKYASSDAPKNSPILRQVLDVAERGRSLRVILFAAEQFRSAIHDRVKGNCSTHAYGRTNAVETAKSDYKSIPTVYKTMLTRLNQGEYIVQHPIFRSMLKIKFPKPIYKQFK